MSVTCVRLWSISSQSLAACMFQQGRPQWRHSAVHRHNRQTRGVLCHQKGLFARLTNAMFKDSCGDSCNVIKWAAFSFHYSLSLCVGQLLYNWIFIELDAFAPNIYKLGKVEIATTTLRVHNRLQVYRL